MKLHIKISLMSFEGKKESFYIARNFSYSQSSIPQSFTLNMVVLSWLWVPIHLSAWAETWWLYIDSARSVWMPAHLQSAPMYSGAGTELRDAFSKVPHFTMRRLIILCEVFCLVSQSPTQVFWLIKKKKVRQDPRYLASSRSDVIGFILQISLGVFSRNT